MDELHANGKAAAAREAAQHAAEAELRASCTFRPSLSKVCFTLQHVSGGTATGDSPQQQQWKAVYARSTLMAVIWSCSLCQPVSPDNSPGLVRVRQARVDPQARVAGLGTPADVAARLLRPNGAMSAEEQRQERLRRLQVRLTTKDFAMQSETVCVEGAQGVDRQSVGCTSSREPAIVGDRPR